MKIQKNLLFLLTAGLIFGGCAGNVQPETNKGVTSKKLDQMSTMELIMEDEEDLDDLELYFADTEGKVFYSGSMNGINSIESQTFVMLNNIFTKAKNKLPRKSRKEKLNIAIEIDNTSDQKDKLLSSAQKYILSKRKFAISNSDESSLAVLKQVMKKEKDGLYKNRKNVTSKDVSDVILYLSSSKEGDILNIDAKLISKNSSILALGSKQVNMDTDSKKEWMEVHVPRIDAPDEIFEVMRFPVTKEQYKGVGGKSSISDISYKAANRFCKKNMEGEVITPYVFEAARTSLVLSRPTSPVKSEIIAPFDEDDDEQYMINEDDKLEGSESSIITFKWGNEKYFSVSNMFKSSSTTFRCMRVK